MVWTAWKMRTGNRRCNPDRCDPRALHGRELTELRKSDAFVMDDAMYKMIWPHAPSPPFTQRVAGSFPGFMPRERRLASGAMRLGESRPQ